MKLIRHFASRLFKTRRPGATCREVHTGCKPSGETLCLFASYDHYSRVPEYVIQYIKELRRQGCDIVFISTSPAMPEGELQKLRPLCIKIILRSNRGLDFASWRAGFEHCSNAQIYKGILLANDSVLGPFQPLDKVFKFLHSSRYELVGLNDSHELSYHLQSFFLYFPIELFFSEPVQKFWNSIRVLDDKQRIIDTYEIGLSQFLKDNDVVIKAVYPIDELIKSAMENPLPFEFKDRIDNNLPINPSLHFWEVLFKKFEYPFVKRELLTRNPIGSHAVTPFLESLSSSQREIDQIVSKYLADRPV